MNFWIVDEKTNASQVLIHEAFTVNPHLEYILWVCPMNFIADNYVEQNFSTILFDSSSQVEYPEGINPRQVFGQNKVIFIHRSAVLQKLKVRQARVEDNDDLIPIIEGSNAKMLDGQDIYFLAELIDSQDRNNQICVGLCRDEIQGMLATSLDVNMSLIMKIFDIDAYPDLVIKADQLPPPAPLVLSVIGDLRLLNKAAVEITLSHQHCLFVHADKMRLPSIVEDGQASLKPFLQGLIEEHGDPNLQAIVFWGFPRSEQDIATYKHALFFEMDAVFELANVADDAEDEEEDEFMQQHLDGVEVLREIFFNQDPEVYGTGHRPKLQWRKVAFERDSLQSSRPEDLQKLYSTLGTLLEDHRQRVEATKAINSEKPPKANGFAITALCMYKEFHSRSIDLIKFAFEKQPDVDYCLYMVPCQEESSLLMSCFNFVKTRPGVSFDQSLYIINRAYFYALEYLTVTRASASMLPDVYQFIQPVRQRDRLDIVETIQRAVEENDVEASDNPTEIAFAVMIHNKIVGLAMFSRKILSSDDITWYRDRYHLDEVLSLSRHLVKNQYMLTHWLIDPVVSAMSRTVMHDIMRMCHKSVFYYHCDKLDPPPKEVLENFVIVRPRQKPEGSLGETVERPAHAVHTLGPDAPLYCLVKHHLAKGKTIVGKRVVIAGGSAQSYAFLETLCALQDIYLPNIYMVLSIPPPPLKETDYLMIDAEESKHDEEFSGCLSLQDVDYPTSIELWAMGYFHRVNVVRGHLTDIDRENRAVVLSDELVLEYDYLLISTSTQDNSHRLIPSLANIHPAKCADAGIFTLGNPSADLIALSYVKKRTASRAESVVIAGKAIKVLVAAESLVRAGVDPNKIACVVNDVPSLIEGSGEPLLSNFIAQSGQIGGIKDLYFKAAIGEVVLSRTGFIQAVDLYEVATTTSVTAIKQETKQEFTPVPQSLSCSALLLCGGSEYQSCERDVFAAINDCGLVFDGGLVVDIVSLLLLVFILTVH
ncbi:DUF4821 domain-containing protein [archaeon]|nr:MAG: DUF4821 domain-containing protein [archaeon]